jgi:hypothetical protein
MHRKILALAFAAAVFAAPGFAQSSKLNGTWKLDNSKSDFGQFRAGGPETDTIEVTATDFKQHVTSESPRGTQSYTRACTINGQETKLTPDNPNAHVGPVLLDKITCAWDGGSLVVTEGAQMQGNELTDKLTFSVSDDGNTLTMTSHITSATINGDRKLVYDRTTASAAAAASSSSDAAAPAPNGGMPATGGAMAMIHTAGSHPDFNGAWKLDAAKSNFGQMGGPSSGTITITDNGSSIAIVNDQQGGPMGDMKIDSTVTTDGAESTSTMMGSPVKSTAQWDGTSLVVNSKTSFGGSDVTIKATYSVSDDGKTLTVKTHAESGMGPIDSTAVYDKQ